MAPVSNAEARRLQQLRRDAAADAQKGPSTTVIKASAGMPLMSHEERRKLIERPFMSRYIPGKSWAGINTGNAGSVPVEGHRTWQVSPQDESYLRYGKADDEGSAD